MDGTVPADQRSGPLKAFRDHDHLEVALVRSLSVGCVLNLEEGWIEGLVEALFDEGLAGSAARRLLHHGCSSCCCRAEALSRDDEL